MAKIISAATASKAVSTGMKYGAGAVGFGIGMGAQVALQNFGPSLPSFIPDTIKKMLPGGLMMLAAYAAIDRVSDERWKALITGLGISGGADILRRLLGPYIPWIMSNIPGNGLDGRRRRRKGMGDAGYAPVNVGDFQMSYYAKNAFQGLRGTSAYALNGGFSVQGTSPYALNGGFSVQGTSPYALNGRGMRGAAMNAYLLN